MHLSKVQSVIRRKISKQGSTYYSGDDSVKGVLLKGEYRRFLTNHFLVTHYNATLNSGEIISRGNDAYVPLKTDKTNVRDADMYQRTFLLPVNASGDLKSYVDQSIASRDVWDLPIGTEGTDFGWVVQKTGVKVHFDNISMRGDESEIGVLQKTIYHVYMPWSVNASYTPLPESRFTDRNGKDWKIEDVDDRTYINEAYLLQVSLDER